jgi:hypothetical protein
MTTELAATAVRIFRASWQPCADVQHRNIAAADPIVRGNVLPSEAGDDGLENDLAIVRTELVRLRLLISRNGIWCAQTC